MKIILYSGGQEPNNRRLHEALAQLAGKKKNKSFTYIPVWSDSAETYFKRAIRRYSAVGFKKFTMLPIDQKINPTQLKKALKSDVIYLAGGNTFYFLYHLKKNKLIPALKKFAKQGGVLAGLSAGALILTPNIQLAGYPDFDSDENEVGLKQLSALGLVSFEFFPHYTRSVKLKKALLNYSKKTKRSIYACPDGSGLAIKNNQIQILGRAYLFKSGKMYKPR